MEYSSKTERSIVRAMCGKQSKTERSTVRAMCGEQLKDRKIHGESNM